MNVNSGSKTHQCSGVQIEKNITYPILNAGGCAKLNPTPAAPDWGVMEGLAEGAGDAAAPAPKVNTPEVLFVAPNPLAPPN